MCVFLFVYHQTQSDTYRSICKCSSTSIRPTVSTAIYSVETDPTLMFPDSVRSPSPDHLHTACRSPCWCCRAKYGSMFRSVKDAQKWTMYITRVSCRKAHIYSFLSFVICFVLFFFFAVTAVSVCVYVWRRDRSRWCDNNLVLFFFLYQPHHGMCARSQGMQTVNNKLLCFRTVHLNSLELRPKWMILYLDWLSRREHDIHTHILYATSQRTQMNRMCVCAA